MPVRTRLMDSGLGLRTLPRIIWVDIFSILLITLMVSSAVGKVAAGTAPFVNHAPDASAGSLDSARLYLYAGESIIKPVSGLERVAVGDPGIADVTVIEEDTLLVNGISAGYTTLMIWNSTGIEKFDVVVTARPPIDLSVVERLLEPWNITASWWKEYLVLQGSLEDETQRHTVETLVGSIWNPVVSLLTVEERTADKEVQQTSGVEIAADELRAQEIKRTLGLPGVSVQVVRDLAILEGRVAAAADRLRAAEIARQFSPEILNLIEVAEAEEEALTADADVCISEAELDTENEGLEEGWEADSASIIEGIRELCAEWGYSLDCLGGVFILEGEVEDARRKDVLIELLKAHGLTFVDATTNRQREAAHGELAGLQAVLQELPGLWDVKLSKKGKRLILEGWGKDPAVMDVAESLVRDYGTPLGLEVSNLIQLYSEEEMVKAAPSLIQKEMGIPGLVVRWVGDALVLEGTLNPKDHQAAVALAGQYSSNVVDLISNGNLSALTIAQIKNLIGSGSVSVKAVGNTVLLKGTASSSEEKEAMLAVAAAFGYPVIDAVMVSTPEVEPEVFSEADIAGAIGLEAIKVSILNGTVLQDGTVEAPGDKLRAERIADAFGAPVVSLISLVEPPIQEDNSLEMESARLWEQLVEEAAAQGAVLYKAASTPVLAGQVTPEAGAYLESLLNSELPHWINRLETVDPEPQLPSLELISSALGNPAVKCTYVGSTLVLQGQVESEEEQRRVEAIASMFGVPVASFVTQADGVQQVWVDVCMLELSYSGHRELGIDWHISLEQEEPAGMLRTLPGGLSDAEQEPKSAFSVIVGPLWAETHLHSLLRSGKARVLASPSLLTENRQQAEFLAGGEIPVPTDVEGVDWKSYGVGLKVTPTILDNGSVHLQVEPEVSSLDWDNAVQLENALIPGVRTRRWRTQAAVEPGKALVIGGLLSEEETSLDRQVPILGELPILGSLFRSEMKTTLKTDLIVLVSPRVIDGQEMSGLEFTLER